jgi:hypothetical protein
LLCPKIGFDQHTPLNNFIITNSFTTIGFNANTLTGVSKIILLNNNSTKINFMLHELNTDINIDNKLKSLIADLACIEKEVDFLAYELVDDQQFLDYAQAVSEVFVDAGVIGAFLLGREDVKIEDKKQLLIDNNLMPEYFCVIVSLSNGKIKRIHDSYATKLVAKDDESNLVLIESYNGRLFELMDYNGEYVVLSEKMKLGKNGMYHYFDPRDSKYKLCKYINGDSELICEFSNEDALNNELIDLEIYFDFNP